jgi:preprotein translocase SecE subunit
MPGEELLHDEEPAQASGARGVEEALSALQQAHCAQGNEVAMASLIARTITNTRGFVTEVTDEMKKVTWPDVSQLKNATLVIIVFVFIVAAVIWVMDFGVRNVIGLIMNIFAR